jgi:hypothetical protein
MTPEERELLHETHRIVQENQKILRSVRRTMRIESGLRILYWLVIIGLSVGAYYVAQPYIDGAKGLYGQIQGGSPVISQDSSLIQNLLKGFTGGGVDADSIPQ